jgi:hypothetical protein
MYKVWIGNVPVECDSAEAALALAAKAEGVAIPNTKVPNVKSVDVSNGESRWTRKRVQDFFELIDGNQKKLIEALLENTDGQTHTQLLRQLSLVSGKALGGVMAGATKNAKKIGADPGDLFNKKSVTIDGKHAHEYFLTESFRKAVLQARP